MRETSKIFLFTLLGICSFDASAASLFYVESEKGSNTDSTETTCNGYLLEVSSRQKNKVFATSGCPENIIIHKNLLYFTVKSRLFSKQIDRKENTETLLGTLPTENTKIWIDKETGNLRGAYVLPIESSLIKDAKGQHQSFDFENKTYKVTKTGIVGMAIGVEFKNGQWTRIEQKPTNDEIWDSQGGLDALDSNPEFGAGTNVTKVSIHSWEFLEKNKKAEDNIKKVLKEPNLRKMELNDKKTAYYTTWDHNEETRGPETPIYICDKPCKKLKKLKLKVKDKTPVSMTVKDNYLLIVGEEIGFRVYDLTSGKVALKIQNANLVTWVN